jgi:type 1 glutamine amidotransferase
VKSALIVWGGWAGHEPEACAGIVRAMLAEEGFAVRVEPTPEVFVEADLAQFDLIVPVITQSTLSRPALAALLAAVESGVGLGGFHGGMGDSFRTEVAYQFMVGGQWVAHPGNIIDYRVRVTRPDDPVMAGIGDFAYRSEQYYMHVDPNNEVLATTTFTGDHAPWIDGHVMPVVWKRRHGAGRVFYSALGHIAAEFAVPEMATILRRGLLWAAR